MENKEGISSLIVITVMGFIALFAYFMTNPNRSVLVSKHYTLTTPSYGAIAYCFELKNINLDDNLAKMQVEIIDNQGKVQCRKEFFLNDNFLPGKSAQFCDEYTNLYLNGKIISYTDKLEGWEYKLYIKGSSFFSRIFGFREVSENKLNLNGE
jgi:hypothetical protein